MFLQYLTEPQKQAFFALANQMIQADNIVAAAEVCYRDLLLREAGLAQMPPISDDQISQLYALFDDRQSRSTLIIELLVLAIVDGKYHPDEANYAQAIISHYGFLPADQDRFNRIAEQLASSMTTFWDLIQEAPAS